MEAALVPASSSRRTLRPLVHALVTTTLAILIASSARATVIAGNWTPHGVPLAIDPGDALVGIPIVDQAGGLFLAWLNKPVGGTSYDVRVQHILPSGARDPAWPADGVLAGRYGGSFDAKLDRAGGIYVLSGSERALRIAHLTATGVTAPGWPSGGLDPGLESDETWAVDGSGRVWVFGVMPGSYCYEYQCSEWTDLVAVRLAPDGSFVPGWEPPGKVVRRYGFTGGGHVKARGFSNGAAVILTLYTSNLTDIAIMFAHIYPDGTSTLAAVETNAFPSTFFDVDDQGVAFITLGSYYGLSAVEKFDPARLWTWPGWTYPATLGAYGPGDVLRDGRGGAYLVSQVPPDRRWNHVLPDGTADPAWPLSGISERNGNPPTQTELRHTFDGQHGIFEAWADTRGADLDLYANRIQPDGTRPPGWLPSGTPLCIVPGSEQNLPYSASDNLGNVFVVWRDSRNGNRDIYGQKIVLDSPVPTQVQRAYAELVNDHVAVTWQLADDIGANLIAERSTDGGEWTTLGAVAPGGASNEWRIEDDAPIVGALNSYRLREPSTGWTGGETSIVVPSISAARFVSVAPNPVNETTRVNFAMASAAGTTFEVTDIQGRQVARRAIDLTRSGASSTSWPELSRLPAGLYWLRATQPGSVLTTRFVVAP